MFANFSKDSLLSGYDVVACKSCGFCFADHIPSQIVFDEYYRQMSKYEFASNMGLGSEYELARFSLFAQKIQNAIPDRSRHIVEVGCSTGILLSFMRNLGYQNLLGIDPSPMSSQIAQRLYGLEVLTFTFSDIDPHEIRADALILGGVLEHIRDIKASLLRCWNILQDEGLLYIIVPDASLYCDGLDAPFQEFSVEHINFFGPTSLTNLLLLNGFEKISTEQGAVTVNYKTITPVIYGVFKKTTTNHPIQISPDSETQNGLKKYIWQSQQVDSQIRELIAKIAIDRTPIVVWGTGAHTLRLLATSKLSEANITAFVDSNPKYQGNFLNNIPVISPSSLKNFPNPILISSRIYQEEIARQIHDDLKIDQEIIKLY